MIRGTIIAVKEIVSGSQLKVDAAAGAMTIQVEEIGTAFHEGGGSLVLGGLETISYVGADPITGNIALGVATAQYWAAETIVEAYPRVITRFAEIIPEESMHLEAPSSIYARVPNVFFDKFQPGLYEPTTALLADVEIVDGAWTVQDIPGTVPGIDATYVRIIDALGNEIINLGSWENPDDGSTSYGLRLRGLDGETIAELTNTRFFFGTLDVGDFSSPSVVGVGQDDLKLYVDHAVGSSDNDGLAPILGHDLFGRTISNGLGTADSFHPWAILAGASSAYSVGSAHASISGANNTTYLVELEGAGGFYNEVLMEFSLNKVPAGGTPTLGAALNLLDLDNLYAARAVIAAGTGVISGGVIRRSGGSQTTIQADVTTGLTLSAGTKYWIRAQCFGSGFNGDSKTIRMRIWADGATEPTSWLFEITDVDTALAPFAGRVGIRYALPTGMSNAPVTASVFSFDQSVVDSNGDTIVGSTGPVDSIASALALVRKYNSGMINIVIRGTPPDATDPDTGAAYDDPFEDVAMDSYSGSGAVLIDGMNSLVLTGSFDFNGDNQFISVQNFGTLIDSGGGNATATANVNWSRHVEFNEVPIQTDKANSGKSYNIRYQQGSTGSVVGCQLNGADDCVRVSEGSMVMCGNNKGAGANNAYFANAAEIYVSGTTQPTGGNAVSNNGHVNGSATGTAGTGHTGTGKTTRTWRTSRSDSWQGQPTNYGWRDGDNLYQGNYGYGNHTGVWVYPGDVASKLSGKTIDAAIITIRRLGQGGISGPVSVWLISTTSDGLGGAPSITHGPVRIGSLAWGQTKAFKVPSALANDLKTGKNLGVYIGSGSPYAIFTGRKEFADSGKLRATYH